MQIRCKHSPHWPHHYSLNLQGSSEGNGESPHTLNLLQMHKAPKQDLTGLQETPAGTRILTSEKSLPVLKVMCLLPRTEFLAPPQNSYLGVTLGLLMTVLTSLHQPQKSSKCFPCWPLSVCLWSFLPYPPSDCPLRPRVRHSQYGPRSASPDTHNAKQLWIFLEDEDKPHLVFLLFSLWQENGPQLSPSYPQV